MNLTLIQGYKQYRLRSDLNIIFSSILFSVMISLLSTDAESSESLSYSGRLVNANGSPVSGPVNLKVELAYTNAPTAILCSQDFSNVILSNGVFHLKVDLDCGPPVTLSQVLNQIPANESAAIRVTDVTHSKTYSFQALHSMPFANIAETSRQLVQMGAADGQVLKWSNATSKWIPGSPGGGGTVTNVSASAPLAVSNGGTTPAISLSKANSTTDGYLSAADWTSFNNKVGVVSGGTVAQYYRGDNSWQTLNTSVVPESGAINLYFSNARVLGVPLDGFVAGPGVIATTDTVLEAFGKTQGQINAINAQSANYLVKNGTDSITGTVTVASPTGFLRLIDPPAIFTDATNMAYVDSRDDLKVNKAGDTMSGLLTLDANVKLKGGANYVTLKAHATTSANYNFVLPQTAGTNGYVLSTDGVGNTSWVTPAVSSGTIVDGSIVDADINAAAAISQSKIANLTTDLAGKEPTLANPNDTTKYYRGDKSWQTLNTTAVTEATNLYFTNARVLGVDLAGLNTGVAGPITSADTVLSAFGKLQYQMTTVNGKGQWDKNVNDIYYNTGNVGIGTNNPGSALEVKGTLRLAGSTSGYVGLAPAAVAGATTYTLPAADGAAGQLLKTNGAGVLSWVNDNTGAGAFSGAINKAVITDGTGALGTSATTATELGYVAGVTSSIQTQLNAKQSTTLASGNILVGNGSNVATAVAPSSDVSMTNAGAFTVTKLQGRAVSTNAPALGSFLKWDNVLSQWAPTPFATCSGAGQVMHYVLLTDTWSCDTVNVDSILPTQTANSGKFLTTDGTNASWSTVTTTPAGANGQVQFNNSGALGASANFLWDSTNNRLGIGATPLAPLHVAGSAIFGSTTSSYTGTSTMVIKNTNGFVFESPTAVMTKLNVSGDIWGVDRCTNADCSGASPSFKVGLAGAGYLELPNGPNLRLGTATNLGTAGISIGTAWGDAIIGVQDAGGPTNLTIKASGTNGTLANISGGTLNLNAGASSGTGTSKIDFKTATPGASGSALNAPSTKMTITGAGNVGIGTATPGTKLEVAGQVKITGGVPGAGKVLTSDAAGLATWETPGAGGITSLNGLTGVTQTFATPGTTGTAPNWASSGSAHTINIPMASAAGVTAGLISKSDYDSFNSKLGTTLNSGNILVGNGSNVATAVTPSSDVSMTNAGAFTVTKLQGNSVSTNAPVLGSFLKWDNILSQWAPTPLATCSGANQVMHYILLTDTWSCDTLNVDNLLPAQTGNNGKALVTDGTTVSWQTPVAAPAGASTQVQYNSAGVMGASSNLIWFNGAGQLAIGYAGANTAAVGLRFTVDKSFAPNTSGTANANLGAVSLFYSPTVANHNLQGGVLLGSITGSGTQDLKGSGFGGVEGKYRHDSTGVMSGTVFGVKGSVGANANKGNLTGKSIGVQGQIYGTFGTGLPSFTEALGVQSNISLNGSSTGGTTISTAVGFQSETDVASFDVISNLIGLKIKAPTGTGTVTNKYAIITEAGSGNVGLGTTTPGTNTALNVAGQIKSGSASITTGAVDWVSGNSTTTSFDCGSNITLANLRDGGSYTLVVTGTGTTQCNFSTTTTGDDAATVTYRFKPTNGVRTASSHTVYSLLRIGTIVYVSWISGF